jgi:hypothetical protein
MVLDRVHRVAYACRSPRTSAAMLDRFAAALNYRVLPFEGVDEAGRAIYHTNVMLCIGSGFAVVCSDSIRPADERRHVLDALEQSGHEPVEITLGQMRAFAGNMLELRGHDGAPLIALSARAHASLREDQQAALGRHGRLLPAAIPTIEDASGGSVRCMLAAIHLPRRGTR